MVREIGRYTVKQRRAPNKRGTGAYIDLDNVSGINEQIAFTIALRPPVATAHNTDRAAVVLR